MKISELTDEIIKEYCGMDAEEPLLETYKAAARAFISGYTGLASDKLDTFDDLSMAYLILINDMSINRDYSVSKDTVNPSVGSILNMHCIKHIAG